MYPVWCRVEYEHGWKLPLERVPSVEKRLLPARPFIPQLILLVQTRLSIPGIWFHSERAIVKALSRSL